MLKVVYAISLPFCTNLSEYKEVLDVRTGFFVCVAMISVKSKYGSCSGSCTGFINDKQSKNFIK